jgi:hypothetical protein
VFVARQDTATFPVLLNQNMSMQYEAMHYMSYSTVSNYFVVSPETCREPT